MAKKLSVALGILVGGAAILGGTALAVAFTAPSALPPARRPEAGDQPSSTGVPSGGQSNSATPQPATKPEDMKDESILLVLDQLAPGAAAAIGNFRQWLDAQPALTRRVIAGYTTVTRAYLTQLNEQRAQSQTWLAQANQIMSQIQEADAAFSAIGKIPFIGQIVQGLYELARVFAVADAQAAADGHGLWGSYPMAGVENFFGWIAAGEGSGAPEPGAGGTAPTYYPGTYWALNLPVMSFMATVQTANYLASTGSVYQQQLQKLLELCTARPFGVPVPRVDFTQSGQYSYRFNILGNNDLSDDAQAAGQIYFVDVWSPDDITPTGPRGFDPKNPRAWYVRAKAEALGKPIVTSNSPAGGL